MQKHISSLLAALLLFLGITTQLLAADGTLTVRVLIDPDLLPPDHRPEQNVADGKLAPYPMAFVYLAPQAKRGQAQAPRLLEWYASLSKPDQRQEQVVQIKDGQFEPQLLTLRTGDLLVQGDFVSPLHFEFLTNSPISNIGMPGDRYPIHRAEPTAIKFVATRWPTYLGYLMITDHPYAAVTDPQGEVVFQEFPTELSIPLRVACPLLANDSFTFTSRDGKIERNGRFAITIPKSGHATYEIHVVKESSSEISGPK